jgi:ABC-type tungstate transport system substrate-binding protein
VFPVLSAAAAAGLVLTMIGAIALHVRRGEADSRLAVNFILLALALAVGWARFGPYQL